MIYHEDYQVPFFFGTQDATISLSTLVNIMLLISEHQLDAHDAGVEALAARGAGWVITQYHLDVNQWPTVEQRVKVGTEALSYNKFLTYRNYWIDDEAGNRMATLESTWVMMDLTSRKIINVIPEIVESVGAVEATKVKHFPRISKIQNVSESLPYRVRYFDIDANGHVNNAHYFDWMQDSLGAEWLQTHRLVELDIRYEREVAYGQTPQSEYAIDADEPLLTKHRIVTDGVVNVEAQMKWSEL